jgi:hypothetical protein
MKGNIFQNYPVEADWPQCLPLLLTLFTIHTTGLIQWVEATVYCANWLSIRDQIGWVATRKNTNQVGNKLETCTVERVKWASSHHPPYWHWKEVSRTLDRQERLQEAPPVKTHGLNQSRQWLWLGQPRSDTVAEHIDGHQSNLLTSLQLMQEECYNTRYLPV